MSSSTRAATLAAVRRDTSETHKLNLEVMIPQDQRAPASPAQNPSLGSEPLPALGSLAERTLTRLPQVDQERLQLPKLPIDRVVLDNGAQLLFVPDNSSALNSALVVPAGTAHERAEECGIGHLVEHLHVRELLGDGSIPAVMRDKLSHPFQTPYVTREATMYPVISGLHQSLALITWAATFYRPLQLNRHEYENERRVVCLEATLPDQRISNIFDRMMYGESQGRPIVGIPEIIESLSLDKVQSFRERAYRVQDVRLIVSSSEIRPEQRELLIGWFREQFEKIPPSSSSAPERPVTATRCRANDLVRDPDFYDSNEVYQFKIGVPFPQYMDASMPANEVLKAIFGVYSSVTHGVVQDLRFNKGALISGQWITDSLAASGYLALQGQAFGDQIEAIKSTFASKLKEICEAYTDPEQFTASRNLAAQAFNATVAANPSLAHGQHLVLSGTEDPVELRLVPHLINQLELPEFQARINAQYQDVAPVYAAVESYRTISRQLRFPLLS